MSDKPNDRAHVGRVGEGILKTVCPLGVTLTVPLLQSLPPGRPESLSGEQDPPEPGTSRLGWSALTQECREGDVRVPQQAEGYVDGLFSEDCDVVR
jgi:hypothetical protein